jgi:hypothetical protein
MASSTPEHEAEFDEGEYLGECATDLIGGLLANAVEDYSDEAADLWEEAGDEAVLVHCASEAAILQTKSTVMAKDPCAVQQSACDEDCLSDASDAESLSADYPDSELSEEEASKLQAEEVLEKHVQPPQQSMFLDYVGKMLEIALSGGVLEHFGIEDIEAEASDTTRREDLHHSAESLPETSSLLPCSRPSLRRRLRPRELPPEAEEFAMDCLPSAPVCLQAPEGPRLEFWAEQLQRAAIAETVCNECLDFGLQQQEAEAPLDTSFIEEELVPAPLVAIAPSAPKPPAGRPRPSHRSHQDSRSHSNPRTSRVFVDEAETSAAAAAPAMPPPTAPAPPSGPPPLGRAPSPRQYTLPTGEPSQIKLCDVSPRKQPLFVPRPPKELPPYGFKLALGGTSSSEAKPKSAMAMDLGEDAGSSMATRTRTSSIDRATKPQPFASITKSQGLLPAISPRTWSGIETIVDTHSMSWKSHDVA